MTDMDETRQLTDLMRVPARHAPVVSGLIVLNCLVFLLMLAYGAGVWHTANGVQLAWGANFGPATQDGQWWRLWTATFIHFGILHLLLNMWALWDIGRLVECLYGRWRFALIYAGSGVVGNLLSLVLQGNQAVSGGASGAVFSLYGALLVFLWRERAQVARREFRWLFGGALGFSVLMLGTGFVIPGIDNAAHGGGFVAGGMLGMALARPWTARSPRSKRLRWTAAAVLLLMLGALVLRIPAPSYRFGEELQARAAIQLFLTEDQRISQQLGVLLQHGVRTGASFEELAGTVDAHVTAGYARSFEQLMAVHPATAVPSAEALRALQAYAGERADAARALSQGLRNKDPEQIRKALDQAKASKRTMQNRGAVPHPVTKSP